MFIFDFGFPFVFYSLCFGGETQKVKHSFDDNSDHTIMVFTLSLYKYSALFVDDRAVRCLLSVDDKEAVQCIFGTFISATTESTLVVTCQVTEEFQPSDSFCAQGK